MTLMINDDDLNHDSDVGIDDKTIVQENEEVHGTPSLEESHQSGQIPFCISN